MPDIEAIPILPAVSRIASSPNYINEFSDGASVVAFTNTDPSKSAVAMTFQRLAISPVPNTDNFDMATLLLATINMTFGQAEAFNEALTEVIREAKLKYQT